MLYITGFKSPTSSSYTIVLWQSGSFVYCSKSRFSWALKAHRNRLSHNLRKTVSWNDEHFIYIHSLPVGKCIYKSFGERSICNTMQQVGTSWYSLSNLREVLRNIILSEKKYGTTTVLNQVAIIHICYSPSVYHLQNSFYSIEDKINFQLEKHLW